MLHVIRTAFERWRKAILFSSLMVLAAAVVLSAVAMGQGVSTVPSVKHKLTGFVGIAAGQTARLSVVNLGPRSADVRLQIIDMNGPVAVQQCGKVDQPGSQSVCRLAPGWEVALEISADQLLLGTDGRTPLRAVVSMNAGAEEVVPTFEIFDYQTGRTTVVMPCIIDMN
jgi:hypothetical protein